MKENSGDFFEKQLSKAVKDAVDSVPVDNKETVKVNIQTEINKYHKRKRRIRTFVSIAVLALVFFSGVLVGTGNTSTADIWFFNTTKTFIDNILSISGSDSKNEIIEYDEPEPQRSIVVAKEYIDYEEASGIIDYQINMPSYMPDGYDFQGIFVTNPEYPLSTVELMFSNKDYESVQITQFPLQNTAFSHNIRTNEAEVKTIDINGFEANLIIFSDKSHLVWQSLTMYYIIHGPIDEIEIVNMANSMF